MLYFAIDAMKILIPALILLAVAAVFAVLLVFLSKKLAVYKDPRIDEVAAHLPKANCGGCGYAGCEGFAAALVEGKASLSACQSTPKVSREKIAEILGSGDAGGEETVAVVRCNGGKKCKDKYSYMGYGDCQSAQLLAGGRKECPVGCMGLGSCTKACGKDAIRLNENSVPAVDPAKCISCGQCIAACPKTLIARVPRTAKVYVACMSRCKGREVREHCTGGCIACGLCAKNCPEGAIEMRDNLPVIDYKKCTGCGTCVSKCPSKCIKELNAERA